MIMLNGRILSLKSVAEVHIDGGWNNSMQEYYPSIDLVQFLDGQIVRESIRVGMDVTPAKIRAMLVFTPDPIQVAGLKAYWQRKADEREAPIVRKGKTVRVIRGRKVPIGTTGLVFWVGDGTYGTRCGFVDESGTVHWTSVANVEVIINNLAKVA
jgi:hypothetical protein